ncbi:hypothetical protein K432DRAFT_426275 [Lepidopterella palustris CBS 459.81]|uniref:Uncharacterized protein n=1 Tax=Lepidopterella palustris CBS 459.81 TaxID=1314670 RepID=A0A8E2E9G4_9PEZI|nr:hypothetical protein K432DRAFT_426275 [Lepidopterella palustris CBS 459.81]
MASLQSTESPSYDDTQPGTDTRSRDASSPATSPWLHVSSQAVVSVEHPCIIKNIDKGIQSLGGEMSLSRFLKSKENNKTIGVSLRPDDPLAKRVISTSVKTNNMLLKITVPRRTGRKRKRGSSGPFLAQSEFHQNGALNKRSSSTPDGPFVDAKVIFRSVRDNEKNYQVESVSFIKETHRFRGLPDFQYATSQNPLTQAIRDYLIPLDYEKLKAFPLNTKPGINLHPDIGPPPAFSQTVIPFNYMYRQNTHVKYTTDPLSGQRQIWNAARRVPDSILEVPFNVESVPTSTTVPLPPEHTLKPELRAMIALVRAEFEKRPINVRRHLYNTFGWDVKERVRVSILYVAYCFGTGPWKGALIKIGVDPRKDPKYRHYQTMEYRTYPRIETKEPDPDGEGQESRIFDGLTYVRAGTTYQACDVTDPLLRQILDVEDIRATCSAGGHGWYHAGTWAKVRVIMRDKMCIFLEGGTPDNAAYQRILSLPEIFTDDGAWSTKETIDMPEHQRILMKSVCELAREPVEPVDRAQGGKQKKGDAVDDLDWSEEEGFFSDSDEDGEEYTKNGLLESPGADVESHAGTSDDENDEGAVEVEHTARDLC